MINLDHKKTDLPENIKANVSIQIQKGLATALKLLLHQTRSDFRTGAAFWRRRKTGELIMDRNLHLLPLD